MTELKKISFFRFSCYLLSANLIFLSPSILSAQTSPTSAYKTKYSIEKEFEKAVEAEAKAKAKKEEGVKEKQLFTIEIEKPRKAPLTYQKAQDNFDQSLKNISSAVTAVLPELAPYDYKGKAEKMYQGETKVDFSEIVPGDFSGASLLLKNTKSYNLNKSQAILSTLKISNSIITLNNKGFTAISTPKSKISMQDIKKIFQKQVQAVETINPKEIRKTVRLAYATVQIYTLLLETVLHAFYTEQDIIKAETKEEWGIFAKNIYFTEEKTKQKIFLDLKTIRKDLNYVIDSLKFYIEKGKKDKLITANEKKLNYLQANLRIITGDINIIKTKLYLYEVANLSKFITTFPLVKKTLRIKEIYFNQNSISDYIKGKILEIKKVYTLKTFAERVKTTTDVWNSLTLAKNEMRLLAIKSILEIIADDFSAAGYFRKNFKYISLFKYINSKIETIAYQYKKTPSINILKLFQKEDMSTDINLDHKSISFIVKLSEKNISNPFLKYMADYSFEIIADTGQDKKTKNILLRIGSLNADNLFTGIEIKKVSGIKKQSFLIGFDEQSLTGTTIIIKKRNDLNLEVEKKSFEKEGDITYKTFSLFTANKDGKSYVDILNENISGDGKIYLEKENLNTKTQEKKEIIYKDSRIVKKTS